MLNGLFKQFSINKKNLIFFFLGMVLFSKDAKIEKIKPPYIVLKGVSDLDLLRQLENQVKQDVKTCQIMALRMGEIELQISKKKNNG